MFRLGPVVAPLGLEGVGGGVVVAGEHPLGGLGGVLDREVLPAGFFGHRAVLVGRADEDVPVGVELAHHVFEALLDAARSGEEVLPDALFPGEVRHDVGRLLAHHADVLRPRSRVRKRRVRVAELFERGEFERERPGKAGGVVPVDSIEGPTVRLANGDVRRIDDPEEAKELQNGVEKILDLGEYLVNFGEFVENNHPLAPASYVFEWWIQEFEATEANVQALRDDPAVDLEEPSVEQALSWATEFDAPLHPVYTYLWHDISVERFDALADAVAAGEIVAAEADGGTTAALEHDNEPEHGLEGTLVLDNAPEIREALEHLLVAHRQTDEALRVPVWRPLARSLGLTDDRERTWELDDLSERARTWDDGDNAVEAVNEVAPFNVRERAPTRIGNRMGRPEKSERRDLSPAVHTLFPIGEAGGSQRDVGDAARHRGESGKRGQISVRLGQRKCPDCGAFGFKSKCPDCGGHTEPHYECDDCGSVIEPDESGRVYCERCEWDVESAEWQDVDLNSEYRDALERVGERESSFQILKGVKGLTSANKTPEPIEKGVLRAKHDVSSFKDGTVRYDMTDLPVTAVRPEELDVTADHFRELGYETDIDGEPLRFDDQLVELKVQDIVLSNGAAQHMMQTADFVDDLLDQFYGLDRFYEIEERDDLIGELVFGMAPHTSAAVVGRVVGFTTAAVGYAHPYFHAAKRRNCDGDEDCVMLLMDGLLNFSKKYLPDKRGGQMDAPLVMSSRIDPSEIDDEAHNMDIVRQYPREFYEATLRMEDPDDWEDEVTIAEEYLGTDREYTGFDHTHDTTDIAAGPDLSAYKTLGSMMDKMDAQLFLARKLRAVDETDVAERVIEYHFLPDLIGNLRAFSRQETRCLDCGEKYRRMPLSGDCRECGGRVNLTVHQGSVNKYMDTAIQVAEEFDCRDYTKQRLEVLEKSLESVFENDKNKQSGIADFM